jgi:hypothetical protein
MGEYEVYTVLVREPEDQKYFRIFRHSCECEIIMNLEEIWLEEVCCIQVAPVRY